MPIGNYRFSFGPWNIHEGADPFGPVTRDSFSFREKLEFAAREGFSGIQFHAAAAVDITLPLMEQNKHLKELKAMLNGMGLEAEFVAPRLWEHPLTADGGWTSNSPEGRKYAYDRSKRAVDIAGKLWGMHLNDQNNLKFDEDKTFGSVNLARAFSQVYILEKYGYGNDGEYVGLDIKAMRTQPREASMKHLAHSKKIFEMLVGKVRNCDERYMEELRQARDYEELSFYITGLLMK